MGCFFVFFFFYSVLCSFSNVTNSINALSIHFIDQVESLLYSEAHLHIQEEFIKNHCTEGAIEPLLCSSTWPLCFARCSSLRGPHCLLHSCLLPQEHPSFVLPTTSSLHLLSFSLYKIHQECRGFFFLLLLTSLLVHPVLTHTWSLLAAWQASHPVSRTHLCEHL